LAAIASSLSCQVKQNIRNPVIRSIPANRFFKPITVRAAPVCQLQYDGVDSNLAQTAIT
jgi:hypothetical protein